MADFIIGGQVNIDGGNAERSVGNIKTQLREAQRELIAMSDKFGATSKEAVKAAQKVGELKDKIGDAKLLSDAFNPDAKFKAFSNAIQGVVGGFAALQGAQALFGSESEDLQKVLVKVQSAMALSQGLNSILESKDAFKALGAVIKTQVVGAFSSMKAAIASTGIGLLIIGIGVLIQQMSAMADAAEEAAAAQKKLNEQQKNYADISLKGELKYLERTEKLEIAKAKLAGKSEDEIFQMQQEFKKDKLRSQVRYYDEVKKIDSKAGEEILSLIKDGIVEGQLAEADNQLKQKEKRKKHNDELLALEKKHKEDVFQANQSLEEQLKSLREENYLSTFKDEDERAKAKLILDYENKRKEINQSIADEDLKQKALAELDINYTNQKNAITEARALKDKEAKDKQAQTELDAMFAELDAELAFADELIKLDDERVAKEKKNSEDRIKQAELEAQAKAQYYKDIGNAMGILSDLIGKDTATGKALAVAQATINTWLGATEVLRAKSVLPEPAATISKVVNVAAIVASGIKSVKEILKTKVPGGSGGGGGSLPSAASAAAIQAPIQAQLQTTTLNQSQIQQMGNAAVRSFVVESDVSGNQERIRRLNRAARIN
jgi:hypothetical protein